MALKEAALKQPTSQEQTGSPNPTAKELGSDVREGAVGATAEDKRITHDDVSALVTDEVLRYRIRTLLEEKPTPPRLRRFLNHPLVIGLVIAAVGFILTTTLGGILANYYSVRQQELASQRSFSDELNKLRIQKIGEVWEQIDKNETLLDSLLEQANKPSLPDGQKNQTVDTINNLIQEDRAIINKNRFWLGEQNYNKFQGYLDKNVKIALNMLLARPETDFSEILEDRKHAKQDILQIRESMRLEGQPAGEPTNTGR